MGKIKELSSLLEDNFQQVKTPMQTTRDAMIHTDDDVYVVCSACINEEGLVVASVRHADPLFFNVVTDEDARKHHWEQGFVTNRFSFVTREEAWIIAERQGQIRRHTGCESSKRLYSENLY